MSLHLVKPSLDELRRLVGASEIFDRERSSFSLYPEGLVRGGVIELFGIGKTEFLAHFLKERQEYMTAWVEKEISVNPYALRQKGVRMEKVLFIEAHREISWCLAQILSSNCFQCVAVHGENFLEKDLRRYQLLAEKSLSHFFILSDEPHRSWVPHLQLEIQRQGSRLEAHVYKRRGGG